MILKLHRFSTPLPWVYEGWEPISPTDVQISTRTRNDRGPHVQVDTKQPAPELDHELRIVTWNVWFDATLQELRYRHLIHILGENDPDVVCLQEVTPSFERILRNNSIARSRWLLTRLEDEQAVTGMHYGTIFLVRKALVMERGYIATVSFSLYPDSVCGRGISILELLPPTKCNPILIGNTHLEYSVQDRRAQMQFCTRALSSSSDSSRPALSVLCGDTNIKYYSEIAGNFLSEGYVDALVAANPPPPPNDEGEDKDKEDHLAALDLFQYMPTYGRAGIKFKNKASKERVGRLDYILCCPDPLPPNSQNEAPGTVDSSQNPESSSETQRLSILSAGLLGSDALSNEVVTKEAGVDDPEMSVFPSDHLGVYAVINVLKY